MFTKVTAKIGKTAALGLIVATVGLGLFAGGGSAYARDNQNEGAEGCYYAGVLYSDGAIVRQDNGALYKCVNGSWVFHCGGCVTGSAMPGLKGGTRAVVQQPVGIFQVAP
jgi:hypothetical protein